MRSPDKLEHGALQLFCVSSVDTESWYNRRAHPRDRVTRHLQYERYLLDDVVPLIHQVNPHRGDRPHGMQLRRIPRDGDSPAPSFHLHVRASAWVVRSTFLSFSTATTIRTAYFLSPLHFLANLSDPTYLDQYRRNKWILATGEYDICRSANESFSGLLHSKGIPHSLHVWGYGSKHDWPDWQPMAAAYLP